MNYKALTNSYLNFCRASGLSKTTISNYARALDLFGRTLAETGEEAPSAQSVLAFKQHLHETGAKQSTVSLYLREISLFFDWAVEIGATEKNPFTRSLTKMKQPPRQPYENLLTRAEIAALLSPTRPSGATRALWPRNYAIVALLLTSGLRNSELRALTPDDLDFGASRILVRFGKGGKSRYVAFPPVAQKAVEEYLKSGLRPEFSGNSAPLFGIGSSEQNFHALDRASLSELVERHVRLVTGRDGVRTHALRHANASFLLSSGTSIEVLQELLGHASPQTTKVYAEFLTQTAPTDAAVAVFAAAQSA